MRKIIVVAISALLLGSCAERQLSEMSYSELVTYTNQVKKRCADDGAPQGSPNYQTCWQQEVSADNARRQNNAISRQRAAAAFGAGMQGVSQSYYRAAQPAPRPLNCNSNMSGAYTSNPTVNTTCY